jgi:hypothetical protein
MLKSEKFQESELLMKCMSVLKSEDSQKVKCENFMKCEKLQNVRNVENVRNSKINEKFPKYESIQKNGKREIRGVSLSLR